MKKLIGFLSIFNFCFLGHAKSAELKFPQITSWQNSPHVQLSNHKNVVLKKNESIKSSFVVVTAANDKAEISFIDGEVMRVQPNSRVQVPRIFDSGVAPEIFILEGRVQIQSEAIKTNSKIRIKSAFFDAELPANLNFIVTLDSKKPSTTFEIIRGEFKATFFDFEKNQPLKAGESVTFIGENDESGQLKYDYLLNDKKAPHGVLKEKISFDTADYLLKEKQFLTKQKVQQQNKKRAEALLIQKQKKLVGSFLCHGPNGKLDQCYWKKEDLACFRFRCNAEGRWGDKTERPMNEQCQSSAAAGRCDY